MRLPAAAAAVVHTGLVAGLSVMGSLAGVVAAAVIGWRCWLLFRRPAATFAYVFLTFSNHHLEAA